MLRLLQHLLPRGRTWQSTVETSLRRYLEGLSGLPSDVRAFVDLVELDLQPDTTRELAAWEHQHGLRSGGTEFWRRGKLAAAWAATGGQSPDYLQRTLHAAGFTTVFVHEWWQSTAPFVARDPRELTTQPITGVYQCEPSSPWQCWQDGPGTPLAAHCDNTLANDPGYLVNLDLTRRAPPPVPDDPSAWRYFIYLSAEAFPERAQVDAARVDELRELILQLAPAQHWIVMLIDPVEDLGALGATPFGTAPYGT